MCLTAKDCELPPELHLQTHDDEFAHEYTIINTTLTPTLHNATMSSFEEAMSAMTSLEDKTMPIIQLAPNIQPSLNNNIPHDIEHTLTPETQQPVFVENTEDLSAVETLVLRAPKKRSEQSHPDDTTEATFVIKHLPRSSPIPTQPHYTDDNMTTAASFTLKHPEPVVPKFIDTEATVCLKFPKQVTLDEQPREITEETTTDATITLKPKPRTTTEVESADIAFTIPTPAPEGADDKPQETSDETVASTVTLRPKKKKKGIEETDEVSAQTTIPLVHETPQQESADITILPSQHVGEAKVELPEKILTADEVVVESTFKVKKPKQKATQVEETVSTITLKKTTPAETPSLLEEELETVSTVELVRPTKEKPVVEESVVEETVVLKKHETREDEHAEERGVTVEEPTMPTLSLKTKKPEPTEEVTTQHIITSKKKPKKKVTIVEAVTEDTVVLTKPEVPAPEEEETQQTSATVVMQKPVEADAALAPTKQPSPEQEVTTELTIKRKKRPEKKPLVEEAVTEETVVLSKPEVHDTEEKQTETTTTVVMQKPTDDTPVLAPKQPSPEHDITTELTIKRKKRPEKKVIVEEAATEETVVLTKPEVHAIEDEDTQTSTTVVMQKPEEVAPVLAPTKQPSSEQEVTTELTIKRKRHLYPW